MILMNERLFFLEELGVHKGTYRIRNGFQHFCWYNIRASLPCHYFLLVTPIVGLSLVVLVFGYLLSVFRMKYGGYPYR